ncbi:hypothetical protein GAPWKB11_0438 [Gilliamella apicola]|nr:hypothetical protein GAPWKB11_0438 [Gilliamella apicola]
MYTAINGLIDKLEKQLNKLQRKNESRCANNSIKNTLLQEEI